MANEATGGTGAPAAEPGAGGGTPVQTPTTSTGTTPAGSGVQGGGNTQSAGGPRKFEYTEDRTDWVPRHRLGEESTKRTTAEQERDRFKADLEASNRRVQALAGVNPQDPKAAEEQEVVDTISRILEAKYPGMKILEKLTPEQFESVLQSAQGSATAADAYWDRHRDAQFDSLYGEAQKVLSVEKLSDKQQRQIRDAYAAEYRACMGERARLAQDGRQPEPNDFVARHLRSDPSLAKEFVKEFLNEWFEPARRTVTQSTVRRQSRPVPNGGRGETVVTRLPEMDLSTEDGFKKAMAAARAANSGA